MKIRLFFSINFIFDNKNYVNLHRLAFINAKKNKPIALRILFFSFFFLTHHFFLFKSIFNHFHKYISYISETKKHYNISGIKQLLNSLYCLIFHSVPFTNYYFFKLYLADNRKNIFKYIYTFEVSEIMSFLNNYTSPKSLGDKVYFQKLCETNNIKIPKTYNTINTDDNLNEKLPNNKEFFIKPTNGFQSRGINTIKKTDNIWFCNNNEVNKTELKRIIFANKKYKEYLVQEKLINHKVLQSLSNTDVCTLRIITGNKNNKNIEYFTAIFYIPIPEKDYFVREKKFHVALVNKNGVLGESYYGPDIINTYKNHKFNNEQIAGLQLPYWHEAVEMSIKIHNQLKQFRFVAWDIVLTDNGAVMLEGNHSWGTASVQRAHNKSMYDLGFWDFIEDMV